MRGVFALVMGCAVIVAGCERKPAAPVKAPATAKNTYTVRGDVVELPDPSNPRTAFRVHHEAIDDFKDRDGKVVGMNSMTMEFTPAQPSVLVGLAKGDKIELVFETWPQGQPPMQYLENRVTSIRKLPAETQLEFGVARPPSGK